MSGLFTTRSITTTIYTLAESSQFWRETRGNSQARHKTIWLVHHRPLKKRDLNEARHKRRGYTRGSKARQGFQSTFSLSPCLGFPWRECTAGALCWCPSCIQRLCHSPYSADLVQCDFWLFLLRKALCVAWGLRMMQRSGILSWRSLRKFLRRSLKRHWQWSGRNIYG